jgi:hypothetical protein
MHSDEEHKRFLELMYALRARRQFHHAHLIFFFENNNSNTTTRDWARLVQQDPVLNSRGTVEVFQNDSHDPPEYGVRTTAFVKPRMISQATVFVQNRTILISKNLVLHRECPDFIDRLASQLCNFARHTKMSPNDPGKAPLITYHGKGYAEKDDLSMAFLMCLYWSTTVVGSRVLLQRDRKEYDADFDMDTEVVIPLAL